MPTCEERDELRRLLLEAKEEMDDERQQKLNQALLLISESHGPNRPLPPLRNALTGTEQGREIVEYVKRTHETGMFIREFGAHDGTPIMAYDFSELMVEEDRLFLFAPDDEEG